MHKTKVTCTCQLTLGSISSCLGRNNLKIINLFYKRSQEHQTNFQIMLKYYISLGSKRDLGWFGEFPHIENSILVLAVNCCIYKHYANYVSKFCWFVDILYSKSKKCAVQKLLDICFLRFKRKIAIYSLVYESQLISVARLYCRVRRLILGPQTVEIENLK